MHKSINVVVVKTTTVTVICDRCKTTASGVCSYPNIEMFVCEKLKYVHVKTNRSVKSTWPQSKMLCPDCFKEFHDLFMTPRDKDG